MKLPNGDKARIDDAKLVDYSLNPDHDIGKHKARVFFAALGITRLNYMGFRQRLLEAAATGEARSGRLDRHGQRYQIDFDMVGPSRRATVRSIWIVAPHEESPRLVTCYVLE